MAPVGYGKNRVAGRFANGELMAQIGEAERAGNQAPARVAQFIMAAKGTDQSGKALHRRIVFSVKDCRKRMAARGV